MCGRYALGLQPSNIMQMVTQVYPDSEVNLDDWVNQDQFTPRHNVAPRSQAPVIHRSTEPGSSGLSSHVVMHTMKWGLIPHWSKHEDKSLNTINARGEALIENSGMWGSIKGRKRCAVVCQGYYEWLKKGKDRMPHFIKPGSGKLMLLAGLYDVAELEGEKSPLYSFTIVTTDARKDLSWLHDRQPVILYTKEHLDTWLDTSSQTWTKEAADIIQFAVHSSSPLTCYSVPKEVGKVGAESSTFIEPISERKDGIQAMFAKQANSPVKKRPRPDPQSSNKSSSQDSENSKEATGSPLKRQRIEEEMDSDGIQVVEASPATPSSKRKQASKTSPKKTAKKPMLSPKAEAANTKITNFFSPGKSKD